MARNMPRRFFRHGMLPQLIVFEAVARLGSVTRAAGELHLAQPTVSTQLKKLSETLDLTLFEQRGRGLELTQAGRELQSICAELIELLCRAEERLGELRRHDPELLRFAAAPGARQHAARLLAAFCGRHPGIQASLHVAQREDLLARLQAGADDLYLLSVPDDAPAVAVYPLARECLRIYARRGHRLANGAPVPTAAIAGEPLVVREPGAGTRNSLLAALAAERVKPIIRLELGSDEAVAEAVAGGIGIALLPEAATRALVQSGAIAELKVEGFPLHRQWSLAHAAARRLRPLTELFLRESLDDAAQALDRAAGPRRTAASVDRSVLTR